MCQFNLCYYCSILKRDPLFHVFAHTVLLLSFFGFLHPTTQIVITYNSVSIQSLLCQIHLLAVFQIATFKSSPTNSGQDFKCFPAQIQVSARFNNLTHLTVIPYERTYPNTVIQLDPLIICHIIVMFGLCLNNINLLKPSCIQPSKPTPLNCGQVILAQQIMHSLNSSRSH